MSTYTAGDFAKAHFATHPDGRIAARNWYGDDGPWWARMPAGNWMGRSDSLMAADGWAPFPEPRPLPVEVTDEMVGRGMEGWNSAEGQTFVTAIRAVLTAALAAAPTTDEDEDKPVSFMTKARTRALIQQRDSYRKRAEEAEARVAELEAMTAAPVTPEWHNARIVEASALIEGHLSVTCQWARTVDGDWLSLDGEGYAVSGSELSNVKPIIPGEVEA